MPRRCPASRNLWMKSAWLKANGHCCAGVQALSHASAGSRSSLKSGASTTTVSSNWCVLLAT
eukprot:8631515-Pyramimonas_sp.AAC.1